MGKWGFVPGGEDTMHLDLRGAGRDLMGDTTFHQIYGTGGHMPPAMPLSPLDERLNQHESPLGAAEEQGGQGQEEAPAAAAEEVFQSPAGAAAPLATLAEEEEEEEMAHEMPAAPAQQQQQEEEEEVLGEKPASDPVRFAPSPSLGHVPSGLARLSPLTERKTSGGRDATSVDRHQAEQEEEELIPADDGPLGDDPGADRELSAGWPSARDKRRLTLSLLDESFHPGDLSELESAGPQTAASPLGETGRLLLDTSPRPAPAAAAAPAVAVRVVTPGKPPLMPRATPRRTPGVSATQQQGQPGSSRKLVTFGACGPFQVLVATRQQTARDPTPPSPSCGAAMSPARPALQSTPRVPVPMTFSDFVRAAELQFLDQLRRGTSLGLGELAQDPPPASLRASYHLVCVTAAEVDRYETGIRLVQEEIQVRRQRMAAKDEQLAANNPAVFRRLQTATGAELEQLQASLQHLKKVCRGQTVFAWKEWRLKSETRLSTELAGRLQLLEDDAAFLQSCAQGLHSCAQAARSEAEATAQRLAGRESQRWQARERKQAVRALESRLAAQEEAAAARSAELEALRVRAAEVEAARAAVAARRAEVSARLEAARQKASPGKATSFVGLVRFGFLCPTPLLPTCEAAGPERQQQQRQAVRSAAAALESLAVLQAAQPFTVRQGRPGDLALSLGPGLEVRLEQGRLYRCSGAGGEVEKVAGGSSCLGLVQRLLPLARRALALQACAPRILATGPGTVALLDTEREARVELGLDGRQSVFQIKYARDDEAVAGLSQEIGGMIAAAGL